MQASAGTPESGGPPAAAPRGRSPGRERGHARGQTTLDFAVGMSIFLLSLSFVFVFVPGMLDPFTGGTQVETPAVNRVADDLTMQRLGNASEPYVLSTRCTREFFTAGAPAACRFSGSSLVERLGVSDRLIANVTVRGDLDGSAPGNVVCWDDSAGAFEELSSCSPGSNPDDVVLSRGADPAGSGGKTVTARRVALLDGHAVTVEVVMW